MDLHVHQCCAGTDTDRSEVVSMELKALEAERDEAISTGTKREVFCAQNLVIIQRQAACDDFVTLWCMLLFLAATAFGALACELERRFNHLHT